MTRPALIVLLAILAPTGCGQEQTCTLIGCADGLTLRLQAADVLPPGVYGLTTTVDGVDTLCSWEVRLSCDGGGSCIVGGDCLNAVYAPEEVALSFDTSPAEVEISLTRGGLQVVSETVAPTYETTRPNGPDCEPVCRQAVVTIAVP